MKTTSILNIVIVYDRWYAGQEGYFGSGNALSEGYLVTLAQKPAIELRPNFVSFLNTPSGTFRVSGSKIRDNQVYY
jgi:hypothetical protein